MGRIDIVIPNDLEDKLRKKAVQKMGYKKGHLSQAVKEAIENWLKENK